jgi:hypothetical protein
MGKKGRPAKKPPEKMYFGVKCTEAEAERVKHRIREDSYKKKRKVTVSDFILRGIGIR